MEGKPKYVVAIDVGTTKIVALLGKRNANKKLEIVGFVRSDSKGIRRGEVLNPEEVANVVRNVIAELQQKTKAVFGEVFVGIAGQHINVIKARKGFNRPSYDDSITAEDVEMLKREAKNIALDEGIEILKVIPQSYIVDNETDIFNPVGMLGRRFEANFNIVVGNNDSLKKIDRAIKQSGLNIREIMLEPLASAEAVLYEDEREAGVALVDIGGGTTDIAVYHDKALRHLAIIPFGGYAITKDIRSAYGLMEQVAEDIKLRFGVALADFVEEEKELVIPAKIRGREPKLVSIRMLANIIQARMTEIIDAIMFEIENSGYADKLGEGIVITGGGSMLKHLKQLFLIQTGKQVRIGYPGEHLVGDSETINEPSYATGVGLLMNGFEYLEKQNDETLLVKFQNDIEQKVEEPKQEKSDPVKDDKKFGVRSIVDRFKDLIAGEFEDKSTSMT